MSGSCSNCGQCCISINLKYRKGWIRTEQQFKDLLNTYPEYSRFQILGKGPGGYLQFKCSWLDKSYGCRDYENRLDICKKYPSKSLLLYGGRILGGCGYTIKKGKPFEKYLSAEVRMTREK